MCNLSLSLLIRGNWARCHPQAQSVAAEVAAEEVEAIYRSICIYSMFMYTLYTLHDTRYTIHYKIHTLRPAARFLTHVLRGACCECVLKLLWWILRQGNEQAATHARAQ